MTDERELLPEPAELEQVRERTRRQRGVENARRLRARLYPLNQPKKDER